MTYTNAVLFPAARLARWLSERGGHWSGTASGLLAEAEDMRSSSGWPNSSQGVTAALRRETDALRAAGIIATHTRSRQSITWTLSSTDHNLRDEVAEWDLEGIASADDLIIVYSGKDGSTWAEPALALGLVRHPDGRTRVVPLNEEYGEVGPAQSSEWAIDCTVSIYPRESVNFDGVRWLRE